MFFPDGQSIAIRLAKQIASTNDTLKRTISRFNIQPRDEFEGTLYKLPQSLHWQSVVDMEELVRVELSTNVCATVDIALLNRAVRALQLKQRAQEEIEIVKEDMRRSADFYTAEYMLLHAHLNEIRSRAQTRYNKGCMNLLCHRLLHCEITLAHFSKIFQSHISYAYPTCSLISSLADPVDVSTTPTDHNVAMLCSSEDSSESESSESEEED